MSTIRESLERIAGALERLVALEERKAEQGGKVFDIAAKQRREAENEKPQPHWRLR